MAKRHKTSIDPAQGRSVLGLMNVPYSVFQKSFILEDHLLDIECVYLNNRRDADSPTVITTDTQLEQFDECVRSIVHADASGWTLMITGVSSITAADALAAHLVLECSFAKQMVKWINVNSSISSQRYLSELVQPNAIRDVNTFVFTGLRWDANDVRFDKTFDLLRETPSRANRIVVGSGNDPVAFARRLNISIQRAVYLTDSRTYQM